MGIFEFNAHAVLMRLVIKSVQEMIERCTDEFDLNTIIELYMTKYQEYKCNFNEDEINKICQTAIENLLTHGKIKVGSSSGHFIVVQPTNDIEQKTEAKTDNEIGS